MGLYEGLKEGLLSGLQDGLATGNVLGLYPDLALPFIDADVVKFIIPAKIVKKNEISALNLLVKGLKANNLWTKMYAIYPIVGGTATTHKYNLKDPRDLDAAYRLVFSGTWTHSGTGALPSSAFGDTKFNPNTFGIVNSLSLTFYSRTNATNGHDLGVYTTGAPDNAADLAVKHNNGTTRAWIGIVANEATVTQSDSRGFFAAVRSSSTTLNAYKNGVSIASNTTSNAQSYPNGNFYLGNLNQVGTGAIAPSAKECAWASIGTGLTPGEIFILNGIVQRFQIVLNRQV